MCPKQVNKQDLSFFLSVSHSTQFQLNPVHFRYITVLKYYREKMIEKRLIVYKCEYRMQNHRGNNITKAFT